MFVHLMSVLIRSDKVVLRVKHLNFTVLVGLIQGRLFTVQPPGAIKAWYLYLLSY